MAETSITSRQKKFLSGVGQKLEATVSVGKAGITDAVIAQISQMLERHELVKVRLTAEDRKEAAAAIASATKACCVSVVGRAAVLYRPNADLPPNKRLHLPQS